MNPTLKFNRMRLVNFGAFIDECILQLDRPGLWYIAGRNLVEPQLGANGAGKSTLLNALFWAITGRTMKAKRPGGRVEARKGKGTTEVELDIERRGKPFNICRTRKPNALTLNGAPITDIDLLKEFGIKPEVLQYTCMFGQSNPMFLSLGKEEQAALFNDLLDLDIWLQIADKAKKAGDIAEAAVITAQTSISELISRLTSFREARVTAREQIAEFDRITSEKVRTLKDQIKIKNKEFDRVSTALKALGPEPDYTSLEELRSLADSKLRRFQERQATEVSKLKSASDSLEDTKRQLEKAKSATCDACGQTLPADLQKKTILTLSQKIHTNTETIKGCNEILIELRGSIKNWDEKRQRAIRLLTDARVAESGERANLLRQETILDTELHNMEKELAQLDQLENPHEQTDRLMFTRIKTFKADLVEAKKTLEAAQILASMAKLWREGAKEIRLSIIDEALEETAAMATKHAERLGLQGWRIELGTERQTAAGTTALGFTASLYPAGENAPVAWETYSGGEETRLQLAMSYGLADVLLERAGLTLNIEFADEITRGLSPEGISDLIECLSERARETGKTIFLIDHHPLSQGLFSGTLTVEKSKTGSHIREV